MKKLQIFLLAITAAFASCKDGKLPNASITGATFGDYVPWAMLFAGIAMVIFTAINFWANKQAYVDKTRNAVDIWFWCGVLGILLIIMGFVIKA